MEIHMTNDTKRAAKVENQPDNLVGSRPTDARHFDDAEETFWRDRYAGERYFVVGMTYEDYEPAYRYGYDMHHRYTGRKFEDVESDMSKGWDKVKAKSRLSW